MPSHCETCRASKRKDKEKKRPQKPEPQPQEQEREIKVPFDADIFEMHQDAMATLAETLDELKNIPVQQLTTFEDLDKIFTSALEVVASSQLLGIIPSEIDAKEQEETAEEELTEGVPEEPTESSPQKTETHAIQEEMPSPSQKMEAGAS